VKQLSEFHYQRNLASKFARIEPSGLLGLGKYSWSIAGKVQNRRYCQTQENAANGSLSEGMTDTAVKGGFND